MGVLLYAMLMAAFPFDTQIEEGCEDIENDEQLTYQVWIKQVRGMPREGGIGRETALKHLPG